METALSEAATKAGATGTEAESWARWGLELFADTFGAVFAGTAACWMVAELERRDPGRMVVEPTPLYPPPVVREAFVRQVVADLGATAPAPVLTVEDADLPPTVDRQLSRVPDVVKALLDVGIGKTTLRALGAGLPAREKSATEWRKEFSVAPGPGPVESLDAAPPCVAGAVKAWAKLVAADAAADPVPLKERVLAVLPHCGEGGSRSSRDPGAAIGDPLVELLATSLPEVDLP